MKKRLIVFIVFALLASGVGYSIFKSRQSNFEAPRQNTQTIQFTIGKNFTLDAVVGDLKYYDFIKDEAIFKYALEHSKDTNPGRENAIKIGDNTIDREAVYKISQSMNAWELVDVLLNQGVYQSCDHGCPESNFTPELLPGGDLAPTIKEENSWVETYEDCIEAKGQLSSEQYHERTGDPRKCVTLDGREFTEGKEGWSKAVGG